MDEKGKRLQGEETKDRMRKREEREMRDRDSWRKERKR